MTAKLSDALRGYVIVLVLDDAQSVVLADAVRAGAAVWDVRQDPLGYRMSIGLGSVRTVLAIARKNRIRLRFFRKVGIPFLAWRAMRRKMFVGGAIFFVFALYMLSSFVWHVEIEGTDQPEVVMSVLRSMHIAKGSALWNLLDQDSIQLALLDKIPEIAWAGVRIEGTSIFVKVIPRTPLSKPPLTTPQNIVASVPGVVSSVLADAGLPMVKPGQFVTPGTVLISGQLESGKKIRAAGSVKAYVWYRSTVSLPVTTTVSTLTGEHVIRYALVFPHLTLPIWGFARADFTHRQVQDVTEPITIGGFTLPFLLRKETIYQASVHKLTESPAQLLLNAKDLVARDISQKAPDHTQIVRQTVLQSQVRHGKLDVVIWSEAVEDIGKPAKL